MNERVAMDLMELAILADTFVNDPFSLTPDDVATLQRFNALYDRETSDTVH